MYDILQLKQLRRSMNIHLVILTTIYEYKEMEHKIDFKLLRLLWLSQEISIPENLGGQEKHPNSGKKVFAVVPDIILELAGQLKDVSLEKK